MSSKLQELETPHVLVVDDEEEIRDSLQLLLKSEGFQVDAVANGEDCLMKIGSDSYDLVLLDLMLPGLSGLEIQKKLKIS